MESGEWKLESRSILLGMNKLWFRRKTYGYGWTPNTWEGWLVVGIFVVGNIFNFLRVSGVSDSREDALISYLLELGISLGVLLIISIKKGEKPKWQWGKPSEKKSSEN